MKLTGYFEHYKCGCVSGIVKHKKDLLGYCGQHGMDRSMIYPVSETKAATTERNKKEAGNERAN